MYGEGAQVAFHGAAGGVESVPSEEHGVREEGERQLVFCAEFAKLGLGVAGHPEHLHAEGFKFERPFLEPLSGAHAVRSPLASKGEEYGSFRVQQNLTKGDGLTVVVGKGEVVGCG